MKYRFWKAVLLATFLSGHGLATVAQEPEFVRVTAIQLNVRAGPGTDFEVLKKVDLGTLLGLLESSDGWAKVLFLDEDGSSTGWVSASHVEAAQSPNSSGKPSNPAPPVASYRLPNPLDISTGSFDCDEDIFDGGFERCELGISVSVDLPRAYSPYYARDVDIECNAEVEYRRQEGIFTESETAWETISVSLRNGSGYDYMTMEFSFSFGFEPVVHARVSSLECHPS